MAKKQEATAPNLVACAICKAQVKPKEYTAHIHANHSTPPASQTPPGYTAPPQVYGPGATAKPMPYTGPVKASDFSSGNFLKGSDVPATLSEVKVRVLGFVTVQGSRSPLVAQIEKMYEKELLPLNKTNIKQLAAMIGDDLRQIVNKTIVFWVGPVPDPSGNIVRGLRIFRVE